MKDVSAENASKRSAASRARRGGGPTLERALELVRFLRSNCPWDAAQTPSTLIPHLIEESHEVVDAIHEGDPGALEAELGDLLLNLAFQIVLGEEEGAFSAESVTAALESKMQGRHPHLFGLGEKEEWEALKRKEAARASDDDPDGARGILSGLATALDPLTKAHTIQERVSAVGFDWSNHEGALEKVTEELEEVRQALESEGRESVEEELGDLLFSAVNLIRLAGAHPTVVLEAANRKFRSRFERLEALAVERAISLADADLGELDQLWEEIKAQ